MENKNKLWPRGSYKIVRPKGWFLTWMKFKLLRVFQYTCLALALVGLGMAADRMFLPHPDHVWMPIKLVDADIARLIVLQDRGGTYTRFASPSGAWGITAVRQQGGIWVVPNEEVSKKIGGYGK